ncbi:MAG: hypothetical protein F4027_15095 [Rhodospirillaceae bacterium]|nr:hypothetical protein [Rhodospirillaceae bacterium]MYF87288.1 hypothetical protein [Rhodospirillaceae bacterium]MYH37280.1 hypothetical protein [Rhodospirillaceae bacterium]MYK14882.1 hypothetical protein [Rhodospirillaceae bacterium]MYK59850.1 hypothetical protein [Rhodospirillaceae bacterium]
MNERHPVLQSAPMNGTAPAGYPAEVDDRYAWQMAFVEAVTQSVRLATWTLAMACALLLLLFALSRTSGELGPPPAGPAAHGAATPWFSGRPIEPGDGAADARP